MHGFVHFPVSELSRVWRRGTLTVCLQSQSCPFPANSLLPICPCPGSWDVTPLRLGLYHHVCVSRYSCRAQGPAQRRFSLSAGWLKEVRKETLAFRLCLSAGLGQGPALGGQCSRQSISPAATAGCPAVLLKLRSLSPLEQGKAGRRKDAGDRVTCVWDPQKTHNDTHQQRHHGSQG